MPFGSMVVARQDLDPKRPGGARHVSVKLHGLSSERRPYSRIEKPTADPIECPCIHKQREAVNERDEHNRLATGTAGLPSRGSGLVESHQLSAITQPEEEESPQELAGGCHEMATQDTDISTLYMWIARSAMNPALLGCGGHGPAWSSSDFAARSLQVNLLDFLFSSA